MGNKVSLLSLVFLMPLLLISFSEISSSDVADRFGAHRVSISEEDYIRLLVDRIRIGIREQSEEVVSDILHPDYEEPGFIDSSPTINEDVELFLEQYFEGTVQRGLEIGEDQPEPETTTFDFDIIEQSLQINQVNGFARMSCRLIFQQYGDIPVDTIPAPGLDDYWLENLVFKKDESSGWGLYRSFRLFQFLDLSRAMMTGTLSGVVGDDGRTSQPAMLPQLRRKQNSKQ